MAGFLEDDGLGGDAAGELANSIDSALGEGGYVDREDAQNAIVS